MQLLRPKSAQLKFKLPYHGPSTYSYLKGDVYVQLFGKQSTSEVRLWVDAPVDEATAYPRYLYNRQEHENSLYHHNMVTRTQHLGANNRIRVSFDQHAAHDIFNTWKNRALEDVTLSGIKDVQARHEWIAARIKDLDDAFDRALGMRISQELKPYLSVGSEMATASTESGGGGIMQMAIPKTDARRMWKRNMLSRRKRNRKDFSSTTTSSAAKTTAQQPADFSTKRTMSSSNNNNSCRYDLLGNHHNENIEDDVEEGEVDF